MIEVDREEFLELPLGHVLGVMISIMEEEDSDSGILVIRMLKDNQEGFEININAERISKNKSLFGRMKEWMTSDNIKI